MSARLGLVAAVLAGVLIGVGGYTFVYAKGSSYLTNDPAACANCHSMRDHVILLFLDREVHRPEGLDDAGGTAVSLPLRANGASVMRCIW